MSSVNRWTAVGAVVWVAALLAGDAEAQSCKPDLARLDPITKERVQVWAQNLWESSFLSNLDGTSRSKVTASIGRYGRTYAINLEIEKRERSAVNAIVEAQYRASQGRPISFGFDGAGPLALVVTGVSNQSAKGKGLADNQFITRVVVSAAVDDARLSQLREQLTTHRIDALRMALAGDLGVDRKVDQREGDRMRAKFACFFASLDADGVSLPAAATPPPPPQAPLPPPAPARTPLAVSPVQAAPPDIRPNVVGRYDRASSADTMELRADGSFSLLQTGRLYAGTYALNGQNVTLSIPGVRSTSTARFTGDSLIDEQNSVWYLAAPPATPAPAPVAAPTTRIPAMTIDQIVQMIAVKIPDDVIVSAAERAEPRFRPSAEDLVALKKAGASDVLMRGLMK